MRAARRSLIAAAVVLAAIQLVRPAHVNPDAEGELVAPPPVERALRQACYDCHSNQTRWPWYSDLAPISWLIAHDVNEGRRRLNFSDWSAYAEDPGSEAQKLAEIARSIARGDMAPWYYRLLHGDAHLDEGQREILLAWASHESHAATPTSEPKKEPTS